MHHFLCNIFIFIVCFSSGALCSYGQSSPLTFIRDAEIEQVVQDYAQPLLKAANLEKRNIKVILIDSVQYNAFTDGKTIFVNLGSILKAKTPNQLIGVLAHEIGHIAHGHSLRLREQIERGSYLAQFGGLLSLGTIAGGAIFNMPDLSAAGVGLVFGSTSTALRTIFSYQRNEEIAADRAAITYLEATHQSARGLLETLTSFDKNGFFSQSLSDPYLQSHPLPKERIKLFEALARESSYFSKKDSAFLVERHKMAQAKIAAHFYHSQKEIVNFWGTEKDTIPALYSLAIFYAKTSSEKAYNLLHKLIKMQPNNPFLYELCGDIFFKNGQFQKADLFYKKAIARIKHPHSLLYFEDARAVIYENEKKNLEEAIQTLKQAINLEPKTALYYYHLALIYTKQNNSALADLARADYYYYSNDKKLAYVFSKRALEALQTNTPAWRRAQDIFTLTKTDIHN